MWVFAEIEVVGRRDCDNDFFLAPSALAKTQAALQAIQALLALCNLSFVLEAYAFTKI